MDPLKVFNPDILEMIKTSSVPSSQNCRITNNSVSQTLLQFESLQMNTASESNGPISESVLEQEVQDLDATLPLESLNRSQSLLAPETQIPTMDTQYIVTSESQSVSQSILGSSTQVVTLLSHTETSGRPNFVLSKIIPQNFASQLLPSSKSQDLVVTSESLSKDQSYLQNWNSQATTPALPTQPLPQYEVMGHGMNRSIALHAKSSLKQVHFDFNFFKV